MDANLKISTEEKILTAAEQVFLHSGYDGSRMQEIADVAGINKALLHYYFRSKEALFEKVFDKKYTEFFPKIKEILQNKSSFVEKVSSYAELHIHLLKNNPYLPLFIINTVHKNPNFIEKLPVDLISLFLKSYYADFDEKKVRQIDPIQFLLSVMSMCVFPFLGKPILCKFAQLKDEDFNQLMLHRSNEIKKYIHYILTP